MGIFLAALLPMFNLCIVGCDEALNVSNQQGFIEVIDPKITTCIDSVTKSLENSFSHVALTSFRFFCSQRQESLEISKQTLCKPVVFRIRLQDLPRKTFNALEFG